MTVYARTALALIVAAVLAACSNTADTCPAPPPRANFETTLACFSLYDLPLSNLRSYGDLPTPDSDVLAALEVLIGNDEGLSIPPDQPGVDDGVADAWLQAATDAVPLREAFAADEEVDADAFWRLLKPLDAACERAGVPMRPGW